MDRPSVSVIVPVRNEAPALARCLASLTAQDLPPGTLEIVVADGGSADGSAAVAHGFASTPGVRVVVVGNPRRNAAAGMNAGIAAATGDVILRLDAHAEAAPDFVRRSLALLASSGADCAGGAIVTRGDGPWGRAVALAMRSAFGTGGAAFRVGGGGARDTDTVAFGAYARRAFERAGRFDETLERNADDEFHLRLTRAGGRIVIDPSIVTVYTCRSSLGALARQYFGYGRWKPAVLRRHGRLPTLRGLAPPVLVAGLFAALAAAAVTRDVRFAAPVLAYAVAVLVAAAAASWRVFPRVAAAFVVMHLAYGAGFWRGLAASPRPRETDRARAAYARRDAAPPRPARADLVEARRRDLAALLARCGLAAGPAARVLEIGCGRGDSLAGEEGRLVGVDLVPARVADARTRLPAARFAVADAAALPFRDGAFDRCRLFTALSSVVDEAHRRRVAAEALRVLRPGGAVIVYDFALNPLNRDVRGVTRGALRRLFPGCDVAVARTKGPIAFLPTHHVAVIRRAAIAVPAASAHAVAGSHAH